jgi:hypothetical protein
MDGRDRAYRIAHAAGLMGLAAWLWGNVYEELAIVRRDESWYFRSARPRSGNRRWTFRDSRAVHTSRRDRWE